MNTTLLGLDIGSSSVKAALLDAATGKVIARATSPSSELPIDAARPGWAEQHPDLWWEHVSAAVREIGRETPLSGVRAIGVGYQMHGLVALDAAMKPVRRSIIWCDSRAVAIGEQAWRTLGSEWCLENLLNSPGNFTAAKLAWVKQNEPETFAKIKHVMLPGDYVIMRLTGEPSTSESGLSEGIMWNFKQSCLAAELLEHYGLPRDLVPKVYPAFGEQGRVREEVARELGLPSNVTVSYRAGDQPNNAFALRVLNPGEIGANAGTSGVVYGVADRPCIDKQSRVNTFLHVTNTRKAPRLGVLLCVNGAGALSRWVKENFSKDYPTLDREAAASPRGARGLCFLPYGNGAERTLGNKSLGASLHGIELNIHTAGDVYRAAMEGIAASLTYGVEIMRGMGVDVKALRAGHGNMFRSPVFSDALASMIGVPIELYDTDGAEGAARGAGYGAKVFASLEDTFKGLHVKGSVVPSAKAEYQDIFGRWRAVLERQLKA
jgi:xylulokinase